MLNLYDILREVLKEDVSPKEVSDAITNKQRILITYDDGVHNHKGQRIIEPYVYGKSKAGNDVLRAYQYTGDTVRGVPKWKMFRLDRITSWEPTEQHFNVEPGRNGWNAEKYNENGDKSMSQIFLQVSFDEENGEYSPEDRLNMIRRQRQNMQNSSPININKSNGDRGPVQNSELSDMLKRNLEITRKEKEKNGWDISKLPNNSKDRGPVIPRTGETIQQARDRRKKERDAEYYINRRNKRQDAMADKYKIRTPKKYKSEPEEDALNDLIDDGTV